MKQSSSVGLAGVINPLETLAGVHTQEPYIHSKRLVPENFKINKLLVPKDFPICQT